MKQLQMLHRSLLILPSMTLLTSRFELITIYCVLCISELVLLSKYLFLTMKQGYSCGHFILTSAMKQVVLHEVSHVYCCRLVGLFINILVFFFWCLIASCNCFIMINHVMPQINWILIVCVLCRACTKSHIGC